MPRGPSPAERAEHGSAMWDRSCVTALGVLLGAGAVAAETHGEGELGEVCAVLGGLFLAVAAGMWGVSAGLTRRAPAPVPESPSPSDVRGAPDGGAGSAGNSAAAAEVEGDASPPVRRRRPRA